MLCGDLSVLSTLGSVGTSTENIDSSDACLHYDWDEYSEYSSIYSGEKRCYYCKGTTEDSGVEVEHVYFSAFESPVHVDRKVKGFNVVLVNKNGYPKY